MKEAQCAATPLLGVIFDENLDFGMHIAERINKAYSMLWAMADQKEFQRYR